MTDRTTVHGLQVATELKTFIDEQVLPGTGVEPAAFRPVRLTPPADTRAVRRDCHRMGPEMLIDRMLLHAAVEAWRQSGWKEGGSVPQVLGTTSAGMMLGEAYFRQASIPPGSRRGQPSRVIHYQPQRQVLNLADAFGIEGCPTVIANACAMTVASCSRSASPARA